MKQMDDIKGKQANGNRIRMFFLFLILGCLQASNVSANYYYSVKLRNTQTGAVYNFGGNSRSSDGAWSGWINVNKYNDHWWNGLRDWIENDRVVHQEGGDDDSHALPCRYTDGYGNQRNYSAPLAMRGSSGHVNNL